MKLTNDLQQTHIELTKEKTGHMEEFLSMDHSKVSKKALELINDLNSLIETDVFQDMSQRTKISNDDHEHANILNLTFNTVAQEIMEDFDHIDKISDPLQRRILKAQMML